MKEQEKSLKQAMKEQEKSLKQVMKEQEKSLKEFVKETVANTESRIIAELRIIEVKRRWW